VCRSACRIKDAGLSSICSSLHRLDTLNLSGNIKFAPATLQQLQSLTSLTSLHASTTGLCNQGLAALAHSLQAAPLRVLDAAGNKISKVDAVTALTGLASLTLSRNPLQLACSKVRWRQWQLQRAWCFACEMATHNCSTHGGSSKSLICAKRKLHVLHACHSLASRMYATQ
jgi:hypothetical protein